MWHTIGHERAVAYLKRTLETNLVAHATLFTGPAGIGKTHLALAYAAALHCPDPTERPCGVCRSCKEVSSGTHPDLLLVGPDSGRVKIDQVRQIQHELALRPHGSSWRVCVVTEFETATAEASNALLKTLEEPPPHAVLLLTALDPGLLLPTIVSRCRVVALQPVPAATIAAALVERHGVDPEQAREIALASGGRVGWAIRASQDRGLWERREADIVALFELVGNGVAARLRAAEELAQRSDLRMTLFEWQLVWRDVMLLAAGGDAELVVNQGYLAALRQLADALGPGQAHAAASRAQQVIAQLDQNVNARLALETLLLSWQQIPTAVAREKA